jgi:hypothetical protein
MTEITEVLPKEDYRLEVRFKNGSSATLDFSKRIHTIRFGMLSDKDFFRRAKTDGMLITWDNKIEMSAREVIQMLEK